MANIWAVLKGSNFTCISTGQRSERGKDGGSFFLSEGREPRADKKGRKNFVLGLPLIFWFSKKKDLTYLLSYSGKIYFIVAL